MLESEYEQLVKYIEKMMSDGCQIVIGGNLLEWSDTNIPEILDKIKNENESAVVPELNPGDKLRHKISGQEMYVINCDRKIVYLNPDAPTIKYPLNNILNDFEIIKRSS